MEHHLTVNKKMRNERTAATVTEDDWKASPSQQPQHGQHFSSRPMSFVRPSISLSVFNRSCCMASRSVEDLSWHKIAIRSCGCFFPVSQPPQREGKKNANAKSYRLYTVHQLCEFVQSMIFQSLEEEIAERTRITSTERLKGHIHNHQELLDRKRTAEGTRDGFLFLGPEFGS